MVEFRPGHHVYVPRIGNVSIASISKDGERANVNPLGRPEETLTVLISGATLLDDTPVPLDWDRPVFAQDGREFIPNTSGLGRSVEHLPGPNLGRQMWYGWLGQRGRGGNWYYEDGTSARDRTKVALVNRVLDPDAPLIADGKLVTNKKYELIGKLEGTDNIVVHDPGQPGLLIVSTVTGRVVPSQPGDKMGSALQFRNGPIVATHHERLETPFGDLDTVITTTDDKVTGIALA